MKTCILVKTYISRNSETIVKVNENLEFIINIPYPCLDNKANYNIQLQKIKGDFEIERISFSGFECENIDKINNSFVQQSLYIALPHTFYLLTDAEFVEVDSAVYELEIDRYKMKYLKEFELFRGKIILSEFENREFEYSFKRNSLEFVEITVENPNHVRINGQNEDYTFQESIGEKIVHKLSFIFEKPKNDDETNSLDLSTDLSQDSNSDLPEKNSAQNFCGKWNLESSENLDEYLKVTGVGWMTRVISSYLKPQMVFIIDGNFWRIEFNSSFQTRVLVFELEKECIEFGSDGATFTSIFTLVDGGKKLRQIQKGFKCDEKNAISDSYIENEKLIIDMGYNGVKAKRVYSRAL